MSAFIMAATVKKYYAGKRVLVTGAEGFIGSHLVEQLIAAGARVTALVLYNSFGSHGWLDELSEEQRGAITIEMGDVRDSALIRALAEGQDILFHLAALIGIPYSYRAAQSYVDVNIHGTLNVLEAARSHAIGRLVSTSTSEVYGSAKTKPITEAHALHGQSPYAASKIGADKMVEAFARSHELNAVSLRPFNTYGPRQSERAVIPAAIRQMLDPACTEIRLGDLSPTRDFMFVPDTAAAFLAIGAAETLDWGTAYNAGTGNEISIAAMVDQLIDITGTTKPVVREEARIRPEKSEVRALIADSTRLQAATGWQAAISLADGLEQTVQWWSARIQQGALRRGAGYAV